MRLTIKTSYSRLLRNPDKSNMEPETPLHRLGSNRPVKTILILSICLTLWASPLVGATGYSRTLEKARRAIRPKQRLKRMHNDVMQYTCQRSARSCITIRTSNTACLNGVPRQCMRTMHRFCSGAPWPTNHLRLCSYSV